MAAHFSPKTQNFQFPLFYGGTLTHYPPCLRPPFLSGGFQEGAQAEKYRKLHVENNPNSKTFIVGEYGSVLVEWRLL